MPPIFFLVIPEKRNWENGNERTEEEEEEAMKALKKPRRHRKEDWWKMVDVLPLHRKSSEQFILVTYLANENYFYYFYL